MAFESPASILYDVNGNPMAVTGGIAVPVSTSALIVAGMTTAGTASYFKTDADGTLFITGSISSVAAGTQTVTGTVAIQGITNVSGAFPVFVSASNLLTITGSVTVGNQPTVNQGNSGSFAQSWRVQLTDGTQAIGNNQSVPLWISGTVTPTGTQTVTGSVSVLNSVTGSMSVLNTVTVRDAGNANSSVTSVASSATSVTLIASNANRKGATIYNNSTKKLYVKLGATASTTSFSVLLFANAYWEVPAFYTGVVDGIWDAVNGAALVTEVT